MARFDSLDAWLNWQEQLHPRLIDLGLERVTRVYRQLAPNRTKILTITVAGTNGKGSCVALLEAIYRAQGYRVGAYTSPHILSYNERIRIDGEAVSDALICQAFDRIDSVRGETSLSYFEFGTLAALEIFSNAALDIQLLEVGLGGRLDAVNIIDPDVALLTTVAIDHVDWLGNTLDAIGKEKAGVFRPGTPAVISDLQPPCSVLEMVEEIQALPFVLGQAFNYDKQVDKWDWHCGDSSLLNLPKPVFKGEHQFRNAAAVLTAVMLLQTKLPVTEIAIHTGLKTAQLLGRFQLMSGINPVLLDVGHNPQAVQTLIDFLQDTFPTVKIHAVFAMMKDKDIASVVSMMAHRIHEWYLVPLKNPRAASEDLLLSFFRNQGIENVNVGFSDFSNAFYTAQNKALPGELILVFGSFFMVSEYLSKFA